jgi:hypothetical protein
MTDAPKEYAQGAIFGAAVGALSQVRQKKSASLMARGVVLPAQDQIFEYVNCAPRTGL